MQLRLLSLLIVTPSMLHAKPAPQQLWYDKPATEWSKEALPVGNGRLGAMEFGGTTEAKILLNENSLWTGDDNPSGGFDYKGDRAGMFGAYQMLGQLSISLGKGSASYAGEVRGTAADLQGDQGLSKTLDGDPHTKWCIENPGKTVTWMCTIPGGQAVKSYTLVSAEDVPARDPQQWTLEGSMDGKTWTTLDQQKLAGPFANRAEARSFAFNNTTAFNNYRLVFTPNAAVPHFQVADITLAGVESKPTQASTDYRRSLDLDNAVAKTDFVLNGVKYTRSVFCSAKDQVTVVRLEGDKPGACTGSLRFNDSHNNPSTASGDAIESSGKLANGLTFTTRLRAVPQGGSLRTNQDGSLDFANCSSLTIIVGARTNYIPDFNRKWIGNPPGPLATADVDAALRKGYQTLVADHLTDFKKFFTRFALDLGETADDLRALPTDARLKRYKGGAADLELEAMMVQYGRYLLISSSRDSLPANLQGLWNGSNEPPWASDYHTNINIQMNYWGAEVANLSELHLPLIRFIRDQAPTARAAVLADKASFPHPTRGWTARTSQNPRGGNGWQWNIPASAWYMVHVWEHYAFTGDKTYLRETAYPMLKEICEFWEDHLKTLPDGTLVAPNGWSPEHGPREDGVTHDQQLVRELFANYIEAADALGADKPYRDKIAGMKAKLAPNKIGSWGQLMEWSHEIPDLEKSGHRHTSHLFSLYPGRDISVTNTPELAKAAEVSLVQRSTTPGDSAQSWAWPWRGAMWARLRRSDKTHEAVQNLLTKNTFPNLFCAASGVFQMDGNFGITGAVCEMLVQSHAGEIHLLPALPKEWPNGSVQGLRARGGFTVDITWKDGRVSNYRITSATAKPVKARINDEVKTITSVAR